MRIAGLFMINCGFLYALVGLWGCSEAYFYSVSSAGTPDDTDLWDTCDNDGTRRTCPCGEAARGIQECVDGSWSKCSCDDPLDIECTPGEERACDCADGSDAVRQCVGGGWADCPCDVGASACTTCHAYPPEAPHPSSTDCSSCHPALNEDDVTFADNSTHMNGSIDLNCAACHGMPPAAPHTQSTACSGCHGDVVDEDQQIIDESLHRDGTVQVSVTGACDSCHGQPPAAPHSDFVDCSNCHWNINDDDVTFPEPATHNNGNVELDCLYCHPNVGTTTPLNHNIDGDAATVSANCLVCHDLSEHQEGAVQFSDPDPSDSFDPTSGFAEAADVLCQTCHDGGAGTYFGGATPVDMSDMWTGSDPHGALGCSACHGYHGGNPGKPLVSDPAGSDCLGCHQM